MVWDAAVAWVTKADALAFLKITGSSEDTIVGDLVNSASQLAKAHIGRQLLSQAYTEYYDGDGSDSLILNNFPVSALTSLNDDINRLWNSPTAVDLTGSVILDSNSGIIRVWNAKPTFFVGHGNIKVVYTAGYAIAAIPYDIQLAIKLMVAQVYKIRYASQRFGAKSEQIGDRTVTFEYEAMPKEAKEILDHHRSLAQSSRGF